MSFVSQEWLERKAAGLDGAFRTQPRALLFPEQLDALNDPSKFKALLCGRRAGKTDLIIKDFAQGMLDCPRSRNLFVALTLDSAREILWEPFKALNEAHKWGFRFDHNLHVVTHQNGSRLIVRGADDVRSLEKLRGQHFRRVRIDECGAHRPSYLAYLVLEILEPMLMDDPESDLWLAGTCTTQAFGFFYDVTTGRTPGYSVKRWTAKENPHVNWDVFVYGRPGQPGLFERRGWTDEHPIFQREYLARWVLDTERKVFRFDPDRNTLAALPPLRPGDSWETVIACDFGVGHHTAPIVLAWPRKWGRDAYVIDSWQATGLAPSDAALRLKPLYDTYKPISLIGDVNGLGKGFEREWNKLFPHIAMRPAKKKDKRAALEIVSDRLYVARQSDNWEQRRGLFVIQNADSANAELCVQLATLQWDEERKDIAAGQDDDLAMATVYGYRHCPAFANKDADPPEVPPAAGPFDRFVQRKIIPKPKEDAVSAMRGPWRRGV